MRIDNSFCGRMKNPRGTENRCRGGLLCLQVRRLEEDVFQNRFLCCVIVKQDAVLTISRHIVGLLK